MHSPHTLNRLYLQPSFNYQAEQNNTRPSPVVKAAQEKVSANFCRPHLQQFQYYSFKQSQKEDQAFPQEQNSFQNRSQQSCNTYKSKDDLLQKYESLCEKLREIEPNQIVYLFIEEIEENERSKQELASKNRKLIAMDETLAQLEFTLEEKRRVIQKMCETQSQNLDIIQCLESKLRSEDYDFAEHYQNKYRQLEQYMNQYICSNSEAQEQMYKKIALLKKENERLISENQMLSRSCFQKCKQLGILELKQLKCETTLSQARQEKKLFQRQFQHLEEENSLLRKDVQTLIENIKSYQQFQVQLNNKSNRQFSSSLEFIREKLNTPLDQSFMNGQKETSKLYFSKQNQQLEGLKGKVRLLTAEKQQLQKHNNQLMEDYQGLCQKVTKLANENSAYQKSLQQNQKEMGRLKTQFQASEIMKNQGGGKFGKNFYTINFSNNQQSLSLSSLKIHNSGCESLSSLGKTYAPASSFLKLEAKNKQNSTAHT